MANTYVIIDGLTTVLAAIEMAKKHKVKAIIVDKRHEDGEYGIDCVDERHCQKSISQKSLS